MRTLRTLAVMGFMLSGFLADTSLSSNEIEAATASSLSRLSVYEDSFFNYDFNSTVVAYNNVDWAIAFLFYGNASVNKVKDIFVSLV